MYKLKIKQGSDVVTELTFTSLDEAHRYLDYVSRSEIYGKVHFDEWVETIPAQSEVQEIEVQPQVLDEDGNVVQERVVETQVVEISPEQTITHPPTHTYEIIDISSEINREKLIQSRSSLRQRGERLIDEIAVRNSEMGLTLEQIKTIMLDEDVALIRELLWTGSLESARSVILEKRSKLESMMSSDYVDWLLSRLDELMQA